MEKFEENQFSQTNRTMNKKEEKNWIKKHPILSLIIGVALFSFIMSSGDNPVDEQSSEGLQLSLQKDIYYRLVELQDSINFEDKKYAEKMDVTHLVVAEYYNISENEVNKIVNKGLLEQWPMPIYDVGIQDTETIKSEEILQEEEEEIIPDEPEYDCSSNIYNCGDFNTYAEAKAVFDFCGGVLNDIHYLDGDDDGIACESLI